MAPGTETLVDLLERSAAEHGERAALTIRAGLRDDTWSYSRLLVAARALAAHLAEDRGLQPGARVVVWGPNCPQLVAAIFGVLLGRLVLVPLDPQSSPAILARVAELTEASLVISGFADCPGVPTLDLLALPVGPERSYRAPPARADDVAEVVFTSGATASPKGVVLTHGNIVANVRSAYAALLPTRDFRLLSILPLSHMFEQTAGLFLPLSVGASVHYTTSRQSPVILKTLRRHEVTAMAVVPQVLELLLEGIEQEVRRRGSLTSWRAAHRLAPHLPLPARRLLFRRVHRELGGHLELVVSGGAALDPEVGAAWERMGVTVLEGYGATECAPSIASNTRAARRPGSVGRPVPGVHVRIGDEGEILVRGANVTPGYWRDEEATRAAFTADGWFRTGDVGELDRDGFLRLRGRLKDVIVLQSGLNVHPEDVEAELLLEESVVGCAVVGAHDAARGVQVHAAVVPDRLDATAHERVAAAIRLANGRLAPYQRVAAFTVWGEPDLPRTSLLKVKRHEVLAAVEGRGPSAEPAPLRPQAEADRRSRLLRILSELAPPGATLAPDCDLALDVGLDSLALVQLGVRLEGELGLSLEDGTLATAATVGELIRLVEAGEGEASSPAVTFPSWALRAPARLARTLLQAAVVVPAHLLLCSPFRVEGRERLAAVEPPVLLVANHASHLDTPSILRALPHRLRTRVTVAAAADYFFSAPLPSLAMPLLLNAFPFSREGAVRASLEHCGDLVDAGWSVLVYPEGTRSVTGALQPFRAGSGLLAAGLRVPVVPIAVRGTHALLPKGRGRPRRGPVTVSFGYPIHFGPSEAPIVAASRLAHEVSRLLGAAPAARPADHEDAVPA